MTTKTTTTTKKRMIIRPSTLGPRGEGPARRHPLPAALTPPGATALPLALRSPYLPAPVCSLSSFLRSACLCSRNSAPVTCCWGRGWSLTHSEVLGSVIYPGHPRDPSPANLNCVLNPSYWPGPCYKLRRPPIALLLPPALLPGLHLPRELCCHFTSTHHIPPTDYHLSRSGPTWKMPELAMPFQTLIWTAHQPLKGPFSLVSFLPTPSVLPCPTRLLQGRGVPGSQIVDTSFFLCTGFTQLSFFFQNCSSPTDVCIWTNST
uniref:Uncharacterized protein n=1 Tax=Pan paniscus TaxID=9597 RepID=A0A2R8ZWM7_PANPA